jgi:hypothetical protein
MCVCVCVYAAKDDHCRKKPKDLAENNETMFTCEMRMRITWIHKGKSRNVNAKIKKRTNLFLDLIRVIVEFFRTLNDEDVYYRPKLILLKWL